MADFINIHTHQIVSAVKTIRNLKFGEQPDESGWYSFGIHPWYIGSFPVAHQLEFLNQLIDNKSIIALGEAGIDHAIQTPIEQQTDIFLKQLDIANNAGLPIIIHCVRAWSDFLNIGKKIPHPGAPFIFHGFNANLDIAMKLIKQGNYLSFGKALLLHPPLQEVFKQLPAEHLFFETDDTDLTIEAVYEMATRLRQIAVDDLKEIITQNFKTVFKQLV